MFNSWHLWLFLEKTLMHLHTRASGIFSFLLSFERLSDSAEFIFKVSPKFSIVLRLWALSWPFHYICWFISERVQTKIILSALCLCPRHPDSGVCISQWLETQLMWSDPYLFGKYILFLGFFLFVFFRQRKKRAFQKTDHMITIDDSHFQLNFCYVDVFQEERSHGRLAVKAFV